MAIFTSFYDVNTMNINPHHTVLLMANVKRCDRCGTCYDNNKHMAASVVLEDKEEPTYFTKLRVEIRKINAPTKELDVCRSCAAIIAARIAANLHKTPA